MTILILQTLLLVAIAYILGCLFGAFAFRLLSPGNSAVPESAPVVATNTPNQVAPEPNTTVTTKPVTTAPKPVQEEPAPAPVVAKPVSEKPAPVSRKEIEKDDLKRIRGIGPQNEAKLNAIGITTFAEIAGWSSTDQQEIGERLAFPGRIEREEWVAQAKTLADGGETDFAKRVDKGEVASSVGEATVSDTGSKPRTLSRKPAGGGDDLTKIDGIGSALESKLNAIGVFRFDQIEKWTVANQIWIGNELGFPGRVERENWVSEAKVLAAGKSKSAPTSKRGQIRAKRKT